MPNEINEVVDDVDVKDNTDDTTDDTIEDSNEIVDEVIKQEKTKSESLKQKALAKIKGIYRKIGKSETDEDTEQQDVDDTIATKDGTDKSELSSASEAEIESDEDYEYEEIDPNFVEAASNYGWPDAKIIKYAEEHDDSDLVTLTQLMQSKQPAKEKDVKQDVKVKESVVDEEISKFLEENEDNEALLAYHKRFGEPLRQEMKKVTSEWSDLKKDFDENKEQKEQDYYIDCFSKTNNKLDELSKDYPALSTFEEMPRYPDGRLVADSPAFQQRKTIFTMTMALHKAGFAFNDALDNSISSFIGKSGAKDAERNVIKKIKKQQGKISPKRSERQTVKKYSSEEERKEDIIKTAYRKAGIEFPE